MTFVNVISFLPSLISPFVTFPASSGTFITNGLGALCRVRKRLFRKHGLGFLYEALHFLLINITDEDSEDWWATY